MKKVDKRKIKGLTLVLTSVACPEQYDVFKGKKYTGYLRLRHGIFRIDYPKHYHNGGKTIFETEIESDGAFSDKERQEYLNLAVDLINSRILAEGEVL